MIIDYGRPQGAYMIGGIGISWTGESTVIVIVQYMFRLVSRSMSRYIFRNL